MRRLLASICAGPVVLVAAQACARPESPTGGPVDVLPPYVVETVPDTFATVEPGLREVRFCFSERISERSADGRLDDAVIVSPSTGEIRVRHGRECIAVEMEEAGLAAGEVYRITVRPVIRDMFANTLRDPFELVVSTGAEIVPNVVAGMVEDRVTGDATPAVRVEARFPRGDDTLTHWNFSDDGGVFSLRYVPAGPFELRAWQDQNRNGEVDESEPQTSFVPGDLAEPPDTTLEILTLIQPDSTAPRLTRVNVEDSVTLRIEFDDYIEPTIAPGTIRGTVTVTDWVDSVGVAEGGLEEGDEAAGVAGDTAGAAEAGGDPGEARAADDPDAGPEAGAAEEEAPPPEPGDTVRIRIFLEHEHQVWLARRQDSIARAREAEEAQEEQPDDPDAPGDVGGDPPEPGERVALPPGQAPATGEDPGEDPDSADGPTFPTTLSGLMLPSRTLVGVLDEGLAPDVPYELVVRGVTNIAGAAGGGGVDTLTWEPPEEEAADSVQADDTTQVDDTTTASPDTTTPPPDTTTPPPDTTTPPPDTTTPPPDTTTPPPDTTTPPPDTTTPPPDTTTPPDTNRVAHRAAGDRVAPPPSATPTDPDPAGAPWTGPPGRRDRRGAAPVRSSTPPRRRRAPAHRDPRRAIPGVDRLLARPWCLRLAESRGRDWVAGRLRAVLAEVRAGRLPLPASEDGYAELLLSEIAVAETPSLRPAVNATGVILHTNLGRAPLAAEARAAMARAAGYGSLEFDLDTGRRGSRHAHCTDLVRELTGAEAALVVNNCAGAVALALTAFASGRGVAVSHGELVEIGGGFRIPEVVEAAGARLVTVGTTNRTRRADYARAIEGGNVGAILKVHRSNFSMTGFTEETGLDELVALGAETGVPVLHDLGSGLLVDSAALGLPEEPTPSGSVAAGVDLVAFSGDKLLGGPQAGILAGTGDGVARAKSHPLCRALRCDKVTLAGLEATLALYRNPGRAMERIPALRMIAAPPRELEGRAKALLDAVAVRRADRGAAPLAARVSPGRSVMGGGTFPDARLDTAVLHVRAGDAAERWMAALRAHDPPVVARSRRGRILLDVRTIAPEEEGAVASALASLEGGDAAVQASPREAAASAHASQHAAAAPTSPEEGAASAHASPQAAAARTSRQGASGGTG